MLRPAIHRYPWRSLVPDYVRAIVGMACTGGPLVLASLPPLAGLVLGVLTAIFLVFGIQAVLRQVTTILVNGRGIRALPFGARLDWDRLTRLRLAYFSVRRDRRAGWMELKLGSGRRTLRIDSRLEGFVDVVRQAAAAADRERLALEPATLSNLSDLGIRAGREPPAHE